MAEMEDQLLTFSDEDFEERYSAEAGIPSASGAANPAAPETRQGKAVARLHGGGNSFMRARRRRLLSASGSA
jgi:hypothetical protein